MNAGPAERLWHFVALISIGSLFGVFGLVRLFATEDPLRLANLLLLAIQVGPLLAFVPALLARSARAGALLGFVSMLYVISGVLIAMDPQARFMGFAVLFFSITLFLGASYFTRERARSEGAVSEGAVSEGAESEGARSEGAEQP